MADITDKSGTMDNGAGKNAGAGNSAESNETRNRPALKHSAIVAQLNRAYLRAIVQAWEEQNLQLIEALGLPIPLAKELATAPGIVLDRLGQFRSPVAHFTGDEKQIERLLNHQLKELEVQNQVDEMLRLGATINLIMMLTGMSSYEIHNRQQSLSLVCHAHRTSLLTDEEWDAAEDAWRQHQHLPAMEHWIAVARSTGISIRRLHASYRKYDLPMPGEHPTKPFANTPPDKSNKHDPHSGVTT